MAWLGSGLLAAGCTAGSSIHAQYAANQYVPNQYGANPYSQYGQVPSYNQVSANSQGPMNGAVYSQQAPAAYGNPAYPNAVYANDGSAPNFAPGPAGGYPSQFANPNANHADEQLLTIGRLFEQQGHYPQAQRIYTELERRRTAGIQQTTPAYSNGSYQPATGMGQPMPPAEGNWQAAPAPPMASSAPVMQSPSTANPQLDYGNTEPSTSQAAPIVSAPPATPTSPVQPSETVVFDRQITPPPKTIAPEAAQGWRSAMAPLPPALQPGTPDAMTTLQEQASSGGRMEQSDRRPSAAPAAGLTATESNSLPDLPIAPVRPMDLAGVRSSVGMAGSIGMQSPPPVPQTSPTPEPARFVPPTVVSGNRRMAVATQDQAATPPTMCMTPAAETRLETLNSVGDAAQQLTQQTDSIRIIPGHRLPMQLKPLSDSSMDDPLDRPANISTAEKASSRWTPSATTATSPGVSNVAPPNVAVTQASPRPERSSGDETRSGFDLAVLVATPEFREIHTGPVLEGLELLARREPQHRALGAMRIAAAGQDARTALPVLRRVLAVETDKTVRVRIAETVLKVQPNDRVATECLSDLLSDRSDWELRQGAASALAGAACGRNAIAIARLTDALDDANPRVRTAAAATLGLFGPAASDSVTRLEGAAANDVPSVQQAASIALVSIRGNDSAWPADRSPAGLHDGPFGLKPFNSTLSSPLHAATVSGRVKLSDQPPSWEPGNPDIAALQPTGSPPKLFPADRLGDSRLLTPTPEFSQNDAVPTNATDDDALPKQSPTPAPARTVRPLGLNPPQPQLAPAESAQPSTTTSSFFLQSEAGASKAGSNP